MPTGASQAFGLYAALFAAPPVTVTPEAEAAYAAHMAEARRAALAHATGCLVR